MPRRPTGPNRERKIKGFSLSPDVIEAVERESERTDVPMSRIVERAIREYLKLKPPDPPAGDG
jgi:hypothetical protein